MSRYSVTIKIVHTWYEDIVVEAASEDGAEIAAMAQIESVRETGEPTIDRYAYCNWMIEDTEPTPDEVEAQERAEAGETVSETGEPARKRSRRRSRRRGRGTGAATEEQAQEGVSETPSEETGAVEEKPETVESVPGEEVAAKPSRSRRRRRRSRGSGAAHAEQATAAAEGALPEETVEISAISAEEITEAPSDHVAETATVAEEAEVAGTRAPARSRNRRRRRPRPATAEIEAVKEESAPSEAAPAAEISAPEIPTVATVSEPVTEVQAVEQIPVEAAEEKQAKPKPRRRRKPKVEEQISAEVPSPEAGETRIAEESPAPAEVAEIPEEAVAPKPKPRRRRKTKAETGEVAEVTPTDQPESPVLEETANVSEDAPKPKPRRRRTKKTEMEATGAPAEPSAGEAPSENPSE